MLFLQNPSFEQLQAKEWLLTNGIGGYAAGTLSGANTRRYHGLLVAALDPPVECYLLVAKIETSLRINRQCSLELSSNQYPGVIHPKGYQYLKSFRRRPLLCFVYQVDRCRLEKQIWMVHGSNTTIVEYQNTGDCIFELKLVPLFNYRHHHHLQHERIGFDLPLDQSTEQQIAIYAYQETAPLYFRYTKGDFTWEPSWYRNFQYLREEEKGLDFQENHFCLGNLDCLLLPGESVYLTFSTDLETIKQPPADLKWAELERLESIARLQPEDAFCRDLAFAADQMLVRRQSTGHHSLMAGYPGLADTSKDALISLPGICVATNRLEEGKSVFRTFMHQLKNGWIPNHFPDHNTQDKPNAIDTGLWLFIALHDWYLATEDQDFLKEVFPKLSSVLQRFLDGNFNGVDLTKENLLQVDIKQYWMGSLQRNTGDHPQTACPVDLNALWYNALRIYTFFAEELGEESNSPLADKCRRCAETMKPKFQHYFYNQSGYLDELVYPGANEKEERFSVHQILACGLPFSLLTNKQTVSLLAQVQEKLYTPYGLRSLSATDPAFKSHYEGTVNERKIVYAQGTVWPHFLPYYWTAYFRVYGNNEKTRADLKAGLTALRLHFYQDNCIQGISEVFDGLNPGTGKGCIQYAKSLAALLTLVKMRRFSKPLKKQNTLPGTSVKPK